MPKTFARYVRSNRWRDAVKRLGGFSMKEMLSALVELPGPTRAKVFDQAKQFYDDGWEDSLGRVTFAYEVVTTHKIPSGSYRGVQAGTVDVAREFLKKVNGVGQSAFREGLVRDITAAHFRWHAVQLGAAGKVLVCNPVVVRGIFVPVTPLETFALARKFNAIPLTRAVADRAHMQAARVAAQNQPVEDISNYRKYSNTLNGIAVYKDGGSQLISGAHKLWILSSVGIGVNYGFYAPKGHPGWNYSKKMRDKNAFSLPRPKKDPLAGKFRVMQGVQRGHDIKRFKASAAGDRNMRKALSPNFAYENDGTHWDYSQLLQLMKPSGLLTINGDMVTLEEAIRSGLGPVWDEPALPNKKALKLSGLRPADAATLKVKNRSRQEVGLYWLDEDEPEPYANIEPGKTYEQETFVGHQWILMNEKKSETFTVTRFSDLRIFR